MKKNMTAAETAGGSRVGTPRMRALLAGCALCVALALTGWSAGALAAPESSSSASVAASASASVAAGSASTASGSARAAESAEASSGAAGDAAASGADAATQDPAAAGSVPRAPEDPVGDLVSKEGLALGNDLFMAGDAIDSADEGALANLFAAGRAINLKSADIGADAFIAAETVSIADSHAGNNLFVAGNNITVSGVTGQRLFAAGNNLDITADMGGASIAGTTVFLKGTFNGDVVVNARTVVVDPYIVVNGKLDIEAESEPTIAATAKLGSYEFTAASPQNGIGPIGDFSDIGSESWLSCLVKTLLTMLVAGAVLLLVVRGEVVDASGKLTRRRPLAILVSGLICLVAVPAAVIGLFAAQVGWPIAVALITVAAVLTVFSLVYAPIAIGRAAFPRIGKWASSAIFVIIFALVASLPVANFVLVALSVVFTLGSALQGWWVWRRDIDLAGPEDDDADGFDVPRGADLTDGSAGDMPMPAQAAPSASGTVAQRPLTPSGIPRADADAGGTQSWRMPPDRG